MSAIDDILDNLPIDQLAHQLGASPDEVHDAAYAALPALLGGLQANATDPAGATSLLGALDQHTGDVDVSTVDVNDGEKAAAHIFGGNKDQVISQLGSTGANSGLIQKLLPMLVPIVLSYVAKRVSGGSGAPSAAGSDVLGTILSQVLGGAAEGTRSTSRSGAVPDVGSILGDVLGGLLGGGRR
ncbi:DUF937 domain-containing protein [Nocardioides sp.]|uniref:DUF937 domain-containing protein n=1 Tax=Nocardioides sp. TaxID=35761 RepID=UPI003D096ED9